MKNIKKTLTFALLPCLAVTTMVAMSSCETFFGEAPTPEHQHELTEIAEKSATCTEAGTEGYYTCDCGKFFSDAEGKNEIEAPKSIDKLGHTEVIDEAISATCTEAGKTEGKHCSVCNTVLVEQTATEKVAHSFTTYVSNNDATCTADGTKTAKCDSCDATDTVADEGSKLAHSYVVNNVSDDALKTAADCNNAAVYYKSCACGAIGNSETFESGAALGHDYTEKVADAAHLKAAGADCQTKDTYWYDCARCASISGELFFEGEGVGKHNVSSDWTTKDGKHFHVCTVDGCDYIEGEETCADVLTDDNHNCDVCSAEAVTPHAYGDWANAGENHKKTCNCGDEQTEAHSWTESGRTPATHFEEGKVDYSCACGATKSETLEKTPDHSYGDWTAVEGTDNHSRECACGDEQTEAHSWTESGRTPATHLEEGKVDYSCTCGATKSETLEKTSDHNYGDWTAVEGTDNHSRECACGDEQTEAHSWTESGREEPTHESKGSITYTCGTCNATKIDEIPAITEHTYNQEKAEEKYIKSAATCTSAAVYYKSCVCGAISDIETFVSGNALGHSYGEVSYVWGENNATCTATRTCANDESHVESETVTASSETTDATCTADGKTVYTATFTNTAFAPQTKEVTLESPGHNYGEVSYAWSDDNSTCTATRVCANDASHVETETVTASSETTDATCTADGKTVYTVAFENAAFATQIKEITLESLGHSYGDVEMFKAPTYTEAGEARINCENCNYIDEVELPVISVENGYVNTSTDDSASTWEYTYGEMKFSFGIVNEGSESATYKYEAENCELSGQATVKEGENCTYIANLNTKNAGGMTFNITSDRVAEVTFIISLGTTSQINFSRNGNILTVNGNEITFKTVTTAKGASYDDYKEYTIATFMLKEGVNTIEFYHKSGSGSYIYGFGNVDYFKLQTNANLSWTVKE